MIDEKGQEFTVYHLLAVLFGAGYLASLVPHFFANKSNLPLQSYYKNKIR